MLVLWLVGTRDREIGSPRLCAVDGEQDEDEGWATILSTCFAIRSCSHHLTSILIYTISPDVESTLHLRHLPLLLTTRPNIAQTRWSSRELVAFQIQFSSSPPQRLTALIIFLAQVFPLTQHSSFSTLSLPPSLPFLNHPITSLRRRLYTSAGSPIFERRNVIDRRRPSACLPNPRRLRGRGPLRPRRSISPIRP